MRVAVVLVVTFLLVSVLGPGDAGALTVEECREVEERYDVVAIGCEPSSIATPPPAIGLDTLNENHIFFASGTTLADGEARKLALLARVLETAPLKETCVRLVGHSDVSGASDVNFQLSLQRATMVQRFLSDAFRDPNRMVEISAAGESNPLPQFPGDARENRRVAIYLQHCPAAG